MKLYVAVIKVNKEWTGNETRELDELKGLFNMLIEAAIGYRGEIIGSELVEGDKSSCDVAITPVKVR